MTDLLVRDPNDSGEIRLADSIVDTEVIEAGDTTRELARYVDTATFRRPDADPSTEHDTGEVPLLGPTGAEVTVAARFTAFTPDFAANYIPGVHGLWAAAFTPRPSGPPTPPPTPAPPTPSRALTEDAGEHPVVWSRAVQRRRQRAAVVRERWIAGLIGFAASALPCGIVLLWAVTR